MKNIYRLLNVSLLALSAMIIISCHGEPGDEVSSSSTNALLSFEEFFAKINQGTIPKGTVLIQSNRNLGNQHNEINIDISEKPGASDHIAFTDATGKPRNIFSITDQNQKATLYGTTLYYKYKENEYDVYSPPIISAAISTGDDLDKNTVITWNDDDKNDNGVVIWLTYKPTNQRDLNIVDSNREYIVHGFVVDDNGSYNLSSEDLEQFPAGGTVDINIARFGYSIIGSDQPSVVIYSVVTHEAIIK